MPISWNEIKSRAITFSKEWQNISSEDAEAKTFWNEFFEVFGRDRKRLASFEHRVKKQNGGDGKVDLLWPGELLVEHKSKGKNLDRAHQQALDYFPGIKDRDLPKYIVVCDFARFRVYDLVGDNVVEFVLKDLHKNIKLFAFIAGYQQHVIHEQDPVNIKAAERMGRLHDKMKETGYEGHDLEVYLVRLLFCLFAEDTGIFEKQQLRDFIEQRTNEDGTDLASKLMELFHVLNTPHEKRLKSRDEQLMAFAYINGQLFERALPPAAFDAQMRQSLLDCCGIDWSMISPAIFGSLFQSIMDKEARRHLGAHYTSEQNILKLIKPLFLDELWAEFEKLRHNKNRLAAFHQKLRGLTFLDPACGCGNFLVIAYRELRLLELEILRTMHTSGQQTFDVGDLIYLDVDQFYGIEIEDFPAQIAQVAMWLIDHQMNQCVSDEFGMYFARIPLASSANIVCANALRLNWNDVIPARNLSYILGNPPFGGKHYQSKEQRSDQAVTTGEIRCGSDLDFVSNWFIKASEYVGNCAISAAFVATNSITQGEQAPILWGYLVGKHNISIDFAHRTFKWNNEAKGQAAVHCVIIGFSKRALTTRRIFEYEKVDSEPFEIRASRINPYLVDAANILVTKRKTPLCPVPAMRYGNKPSDNGALILSASEVKDLVQVEPQAKKWIRRYMGAADFINGLERWCLWLKGIAPTELRSMPHVLKRVEAVKKFREASSAKPTRMAATKPAEFFYISQPDTEYIVIPEVSSERRSYIPIGFESPQTICANTNYLIPDANLFTFGVLLSTMHMSWMRSVCGRLESRYRYSGSIVYNNFPWPDNPTQKQVQAIEIAAQGVLDARAKFQGATLADLYDPLTMPATLLSAHRALDTVVDRAYGKRRFGSEANRVAFLFELYRKHTSLLPSETEKPRHRKMIRKTK